jgi:hypothetical protein
VVHCVFSFHLESLLVEAQYLARMGQSTECRLFLKSAS